MMQKKRETRVFMAVATLFLTLCFISISKGESDANKGDVLKERTVVAKVNGEPIYKEALAPYTEQELKKFRKFGMRRQISPEVMKRMEKRALDKVIAQELLMQESRQVKVDDIVRQVEEQMKQLREK